MQDGEFVGAVVVTYGPLIKPFMKAPVLRRLAFLAVVLMLALIAWVEYELTIGGVVVSRCIPKPTCVDTHNVQHVFVAARWLFRVMLIAGNTALAIRAATFLHLVGDSVYSPRFSNPIKLRMQLNKVLQRTRNAMVHITACTFGAVFVLLLALALLVH